jgi:beta-galactosidase
MRPRRSVARINRGWRYAPVPLAPGEEADPGENLEPITLPHSNVALPARAFDDRDYQFVSSYRRVLDLSGEDRAGTRVFADFAGVMTAATVWLNGVRLTEHRGGFVPFSLELTDLLRWDGRDVLAVEVDSTERPDVPPFGGHVDYLTFGGIYRDVRLRLVSSTYVEDVFVRPIDVLTGQRRIEVRCTVDVGAAERDGAARPLSLTASLLDGGQVVASATEELPASAWDGDRAAQVVTLHGLESLRLWDLDDPCLYQVAVRLCLGDEVLDELEVRTGVREARFTDGGFFLNGRRTQLRGLNRHQTYPYAGAAMPARVQRRDAWILRHELKCNAVRTSHYPQDPSFLDACDELGLLVFEEMPGWQHIGDDAWQDLACRDVEVMVRRDRNHPCIVLWGVRVNESADCTPFYTRTNAIAHALDDSRQTSGVRYFPGSELLEDVFALNDFQTGGLLGAPNGPHYLVSEYAGHMFPTKRFDNVERVQDHALLHATVLDALHSHEGYAGGFGWCAFDYATHAEFGSGDRICYHGVSDQFRVRKPAASAYRSQCDPAEEVVLEPAFWWAAGDHSDYGGPGRGLVFSNVDRVVAYVDGEHVADLVPDRAGFPSLPHPPFLFGHTSGIAPWRRTWGDLRLDGYLGDELVVSRTLSGRGIDQALDVALDDDHLAADGSDATRLVVRVTDEFGADRPLAGGVVSFAVEGSVDVVGDNPSALVGGVTAVWLRARHDPGPAVVRVTHAVLGTQQVRVMVSGTAPDPW